MFIVLSNFIRTRSKVWVVAVAAVLFVAFLVAVLPAQSRAAEQISNGAGTPDMTLIYLPVDLYRMAEAYGEAGRVAYIQARFQFDIIWPIVYTFFLAFSTSWLLNKIPSVKPKWHYLNILPVFGMLADYTENITASIVMARFPQLTTGVDYLASIFSLAKWLLIYSSFAAVIIIFFIVVWRTIFHPKTV